MNGAYNGLRGVAQYLFEGRSLELNRVALSRADVSNQRGYAISSSPNWAGPLAEIFRNKGARNIDSICRLLQLGDALRRIGDRGAYLCSCKNDLPEKLADCDRSQAQPHPRKFPNCEVDTS